MSRIFLFVLVLLTYSFGACAQSLQVVGDDDFPPYSFIDETGQITGIDIDIMRELAVRLEVEFDVRLVPWKRLLLMTRTGAVFGSFSLFKNAEREVYAIFTRPLHYSTFKLYTSSTKTFEFNSVRDLYGKRIAIAAGFSVSDELELAQSKGLLSVTELYNYQDVFRRLLKGGIDVFVGNDLVVEYKLKHLLKRYPELASIESLAKPIQKARGAYLVLSKQYVMQDDQQWQSRITNQLEAMESEGLIDAIVKRYIR